jgi:RNA-binding protein with serine-rich domain 1
MSARSPPAERGRSRSPKSLTRSPSPRRDRDVSMSRSRSRSPRKDALNGTTDTDAPSAGGGGSGAQAHRVIVVSGLTKNVQKGHLEEIFGEYGKVTGLDLPLFKVCECGRVRGRGPTSS